MPAQPIIGIIDYEGPSGSNAGIFQLPVDFDQRQHSGNWVLKGPDVEKAQGAQPILGTRKAAQGWEVWRFPKGHPQAGKPCTAHASKGEYVLMFRPKSISDMVNAIYGNVSKRHLIRQQGESIPNAPQAAVDGSVLTHNKMNQLGIRDFGDDYTMNIPQNPEDTAPQIEAGPSVVGTVNTQKPEET